MALVWLSCIQRFLYRMFLKCVDTRYVLSTYALTYFLLIASFNFSQVQKTPSNHNYQSPFHYTIGKSELRGVNIYDVHYSRHNILYVASSEGLFLIKNDKIERLPNHPEQIGNSIFSFTEDEEGNVYFINLSGQLFRHKAQKTELLHQFKKSSVQHFVIIHYLGNGNLVFFSSKVVRYNTKTGETHLINYKGKPISNTVLSPTQLNDTTLELAFTQDLLCTARITTSTVTFQEHPNFSADIGSYRKVLNVEGKHYILDRKGNLASLNTNDPPKKIPFGNMDVHSEAGRLLYLDQTKGLYDVKMVGNNVETIPIFKELAVSSFDLRSSEIYFLGTFGKGIIVVPNPDITALFSEQNEDIVGDFIFSDPHLFYCTYDGNVYENLNGNSQLIASNPRTRLEDLYLLPNSDKRFGDVKKRDLLIYKSSSASYQFAGLQVKDHLFMPNGDLVMATYMGLAFFSNEAQKNENFTSFVYPDSPIKKAHKFKYLVKGPIDMKRGQALAYHKKRKRLYYGNINGFIVLDENGESKEILWKNKSIGVVDLLMWNDQLYVATGFNGLFVVEDDKLIPVDKINNELWSTQIRQLELDEGQLYVLTTKNLHVFNANFDRLKSLSSSEGIPSGSISKFHVQKKMLRFLSSGRLFCYNLNNARSTMSTFNLSIDSIRFGGDWMPLSHKNKALLRIPHDKNSLEVFFHFYDLKKYEDTRIVYRILGLNSEWQEAEDQSVPATAYYLPPGKYTFQIQLQYKGKVVANKSFDFEIGKPIYLRTWFLITIGLFLVLLICVIYWLRFRYLRRKNQEKLKIEKIRFDAMESQLKSIRSQMNPHFVFNSLNSIQSLILNQETDKSLDYVAIFAALMRKTLEHSDANFLDLEQEVEFLTLYLQLESLRMPDDFHFEIELHADPTANIPSLIIQPFVENSIQHGLLHKEGDKRIKILFQFGKNTNEIMCVIEDNGIGRAAARELNKMNHESFSLRAIKERIEVLNQKYGTRAGYHIIDLVDNGKASGTRVEITIPIDTDYEE